MTRTTGARDLKPRQRRSDIGKRRKTYAGKDTKPKRMKHGRLVPYVSKRNPDDPIQIRFQKLKPMTKEGYMKWNPSFRGKLDKTTKNWVGGTIWVKPDDISTPEKLGQTAINLLQDTGTFNFLMPTHAKNSYRVSPKKKAVIKIEEGERGLTARVSDYAKMKNYKWFWSDKR